MDTKQIESACKRLQLFHDHINENKVKIVDSLSKDDIHSLQAYDKQLTSLHSSLVYKGAVVTSGACKIRKEDLNSMSPNNKSFMYQVLSDPDFSAIQKGEEKDKFTLDELSEIFSKRGNNAFLVGKGKFASDRGGLLQFLSADEREHFWNEAEKENPIFSKAEILIASHEFGGHKDFFARRPQEEIKTVIDFCNSKNSGLSDNKAGTIEKLTSYYAEMYPEKQETKEAGGKKLTNFQKLTQKLGLHSKQSSRKQQEKTTPVKKDKVVEQDGPGLGK